MKKRKRRKGGNKKKRRKEEREKRRAFDRKLTREKEEIAIGGRGKRKSGGRWREKFKEADVSDPFFSVCHANPVEFVDFEYFWMKQVEWF